MTRVVAGNSNVLRAPQVHAPLDGMVAGYFRPVADKLIDQLTLVEWAVALIEVKVVTEVEAAVAIYQERRETRRIGAIWKIGSLEYPRPRPHSCQNRAAAHLPDTARSQNENRPGMLG